MLYEKGWLLLSIELSETPTRSYVISMSNELDMKDAFYNFQSEETLQDIMDKLTQEKLNALLNLKEASSLEAQKVQEVFPDIYEQSAMKPQKVPDKSHRIYRTIFKKAHTLEIIINTVKSSDSFVSFNEIENTIEAFLSPYQDVSINPVEPFTPTKSALENIYKYFKECIQVMLYEKGWLLLSIELRETTTRSQVIRVFNELDRDETLLEEALGDNHEQSAMKSQKGPEDRHSFSNRVISSIFRKNKKS